MKQIFLVMIVLCFGVPITLAQGKEVDAEVPTWKMMPVLTSSSDSGWVVDYERDTRTTGVIVSVGQKAGVDILAIDIRIPGRSRLFIFVENGKGNARMTRYDTGRACDFVYDEAMLFYSLLTQLDGLPEHVIERIKKAHAG